MIFEDVDASTPAIVTERDDVDRVAAMIAPGGHGGPRAHVVMIVVQGTCGSPASGRRDVVEDDIRFRTAALARKRFAAG
jgi:hypothetical protein